MDAITIRFDTKLMKKLREYAKEQDRSVASAIRLILKEFFNRGVNNEN
jgi:hypothetical protein